MVTAVFGSINRAAPRPFRGRVKTKGVLGTVAATRTPFPFGQVHNRDGAKTKLVLPQSLGLIADSTS